MALDLGLDQLDVKDKPPTDRKRNTRDTNKKLREGVTGVYALAGMVTSIRCQVCGEHILTSAEDRADEWIALAEKNPSVKRALETLVSGSAWGGVVVGNIMVVLPVLIHHGVLPASVMRAFVPMEQHVHEEPAEEEAPNGMPTEGFDPASVIGVPA